MTRRIDGRDQNVNHRTKTGFMPIVKTQWVSFSSFIGLGLILTLPVITFGFPCGHDAMFHLRRYTFFSQQFWSGEFYPRWLISMDGGLGSPVFFYYPPVPYWLTSLLHPFFAKDPYGWYQLGVSASLGLVASGMSAYVWLKNITDERAALIAALLYMAMPYHLAIDLYERAAFAEYWTFVWMPLILYFLTGIIAGRIFAIIGLAVSYALLAMTHPPTMLAFSAVPPFYAFVMVDSSRRFKISCMTVAAMALGLVLSAIYLIPAMTTQSYVAIQSLWKETYYYEKSFLVTGFLTNLESRAYLKLMIKIHWLVITMLCVASFAFGMGLRSANMFLRRETSFWFAVVIITLFMMTPLSRPIYQIFPVFQMIQQPWRFNAVLTVATTALLGLCILPTANLYSVVRNRASPILAMLLVSWIFITAWTPMDTIKVSKGWINQELESNAHTIDSEFRPKWVDAKIDNHGKSRADVTVVSGMGTATVLRWKPRNILLAVDTPSGVSLNVSQAYYPGWTAELRGEARPLPVLPSRPEGLLAIAVPSGNYEVLLRLTNGVAETAGQAVSTAAALLTICLVVWLAYGERSEKKPRELSAEL